MTKEIKEKENEEERKRKEERKLAWAHGCSHTWLKSV
jgi:hypothetical protein